MRLLPGRAKLTESVIACSLTLVILLVAAAIFSKQFSYDRSRFNSASLSRAYLSSEKTEPRPLNRPLVLPDGFRALTDLEIFDTEALYSKINGRAELYLESGFERLFCRRFISVSDENLWTELFVYDMGTAHNAFAVFSAQRRPNSAELPLSRFAYRSDNAIFFAKGKYYIELIGSAASEELFDAMLAVSKNWLKDTPATDDAVAELDLFPLFNLVRQSFKLHLANTFGFDKLTNTFTARYNSGDQALTAFLSKRADSRDAKKLAESYYNFLIANGAKNISTPLQIAPGRVLDFYGSIEIVFTNGSFIAGIHAADNRQSAEKLASILNNNLDKARR